MDLACSYLRVDIGDVSSLLGVMALVDGVSAVEILAHDLTHERFTLHGGGCIVAGLAGFPADAHGSGLLLDLVHLAECLRVRAES